MVISQGIHWISQNALNRLRRILLFIIKKKHSKTFKSKFLRKMNLLLLQGYNLLMSSPLFDMMLASLQILAIPNSFVLSHHTYYFQMRFWLFSLMISNQVNNRLRKSFHCKHICLNRISIQIYNQIWKKRQLNFSSIKNYHFHIFRSLSNYFCTVCL